MRYIKLPNNLYPIKIYMTCVYSMDNAQNRDSYYKVVINYALMAREYTSYAIKHNLYKFKEHQGMFSYKNLCTVSGMTTDNLKSLYTKMVNNKEPRKIYDKIMQLAPLGRCPYCGVGQVSTLDHYLPKSKFPTFSVLPYNLVPSCKDCNTGKGNSYAKTKETQALHPYYDDFTKEQWLFARVKKSSPISIEYYVKAPKHWSEVDKKRIESHFKEYGLKKRFAVEAANELAKLESSFKRKTLNSHQIKELLSDELESYKSLHINSWQTALYQALADV